MFRPQPIPPQPGQESVWDYPRPPRLEASSKTIKVFFNGILLAQTQKSYRVLETSHPPVYYIPPTDIKMEYLNRTEKHSYCEWKGIASYYTITVENKTSENAAWYYSDPTPNFAPIKDHVAFYPSRMEACYIDDEPVTAQAGDFYGGWITKDIVGPFKGETGSWGW
jgi:uncharacterized protein (DUF427 family)